MPKIPQYDQPMEGPNYSFPDQINPSVWGAPGRALANVGDAITGLAGTINSQMERQKAEANADQRFTSTQHLYQSQAYGDQLWDQIKQTEPDPNKWLPTYQQKMGPQYQQVIDGITDPKEKARFQELVKTDAMRDLTGRQAQVHTQIYNNSVTTINDAMDQSRLAVLKDPNQMDVERTKIRELIKTAPGLRDDERKALDQKFADQAAFDKFNLLANTPEGRANLPAAMGVPTKANPNDAAKYAVGYLVKKGYTQQQAAGIVGNLYQESGFRPDVINGQTRGDNGTAHGIAQWRGYRFENLQKYAQANGKDWRDLNTQLDFVDYELQNHETDTYQKIKASTTAQEAAGAAVGYERPSGYVKGGDPSKANGWSTRVGIAAKLAGETIDPNMAAPDPGKMDPVFAQASPGAQVKMMEKMPGIIEQNQRAYAAQLGVDIQSSFQDQSTVLENGNTYQGKQYDLSDYLTAYGADEGPKKYAAAQESLAQSAEIGKMNSMSNDQIAQSLATQQAAIGTGEGAAVQQKYYDTRFAAAQRVLKAREDDPGGYVVQHNSQVAAAFAAGATGDQQSMTRAIGMSMSIQQQLGTDPMKQAPLPKAMADTLVKKWGSEQDTTKAIAGVVGTVFSTNDPVAQKQIFDQLVAAGVPPEMEFSLNAYEQGDSVRGMKLAQAALLKTDKQLPLPPGVTPETFNAALDNKMPPATAEVFFGTRTGDPRAIERQARGMALIDKMARMDIAAGKEWNQALTDGAKTLMGDVQIHDTAQFYLPVKANAAVVLPAGEDGNAVQRGFDALKADVAKNLEGLKEHVAKLPGDQKFTMGVAQQGIDNILSQGGFHNYGSGFIYLDPYTNSPVAGPDGKPRVYSLDEVKAAGAEAAKAVVRPPATPQGKAALGALGTPPAPVEAPKATPAPAAQTPASAPPKPATAKGRQAMDQLMQPPGQPEADPTAAYTTGGSF